METARIYSVAAEASAAHKLRERGRERGEERQRERERRCEFAFSSCQICNWICLNLVACGSKRAGEREDIIREREPELSLSV